ncbi:MAG: type II toxin-antitoxin system HigA family antitoxin [Fimbriimonas sp.]
MKYTLKPIRTDQDLHEAVEAFRAAIHAKDGTPEATTRDLLADLIEHYENREHPIEAPDAVTAVKQRMADLGLTQRDLAPLFGAESRVSEFLNNKRRLTLRTAKALHERLSISCESLLKTELAPDRKTARVLQVRERG